MANIKIAVLNEYNGLANTDVQVVIDALQTQVHRDFAKAWGIDADLTFYKDGNYPEDSWQLVILDNSDQANALGYHDLTESGLPLGKVFAGSDIKAGSSWSVTASHELLEMLGDPDINTSVLVEGEKGQSVLYAYENCDACEDDKFGYEINGVLVSDFVFPSWFQSFRKAGTQFDFCNKITKPFELLDGGYIGVFYISSGHGWEQLYPEDAKMQYKMRAHIGSRRERRKTPRDQWLKSTKVVAKPSTDGKKPAAAVLPGK